MTDPRELLDTYAHGSDQCDGECTHDCNDTRDDIAPEAIAALRAVLDLHKPEGPFVECATCRVDTGQPEDWPCPTVQAITKALEASDA